MSSPITYSTSDLETIHQLETYLAQSGVSEADIDVIMAGIDNNSDVDIPDELKNAYLNLTMLKLWQLISPDTYQSAYGQIGPDVNRGDADDLFAAMDDYMSPELAQLLEKLINDSPELMALAADTDGDPETTAQSVFDAIAKARETTEEGEDLENVWSDHAGHDVVEDLGLQGTFYESVLDQADTFQNIQGIAMQEIAKYQDFLTNLFSEGVKSGDVTVEEAQAQAGQVSAMMEMWTGIYNQAQDQVNNLYQFVGAVTKEHADLLDNLARNLAMR
ncbi:hypothetical protein K1X76_08430 [bacterium]|nr:hypothetical protein [bacterium]